MKVHQPFLAGSIRSFLGSFSRVPSKTRGFALVVTLSLMIIITVVAVGMLSLATITLRSQSSNQAMVIARANARMSLMLALGELQKAAGPDRRVTATGDILAPTGSGPSASKLTGVWRSWENDGSVVLKAPTGGYAEAKKARFLRWLVSAPDVDTENQDFTVDRNSPDSIRLAGREEGIGDSSPVFARRLPVSGGAQTMGGSFAFAVLDEGVKAKTYVVPKDPPGTQLDFQDHIARLAATPRTAPEATGGGMESIQPDHPGLAKAITLSQISLLSNDVTLSSVEQRFHSLSPYSKGLLVDVNRGGFKRDLSLATEADTIPQLLSSDLLPADYYYSCPWDVLFRFSRKYKDLTRDNGGQSFSTFATSGIANGADRFNDCHLYPVNANFQNIISYKAFPASTATAPGGATYEVGILFTPVLTLWNPYNVEIRVETPFTWNFSAMPYLLQLKVNETVYPTGINDPWVPFGEFLGAKAGYSLQIGQAGNQIVFSPGESKVFSPEKPDIIRGENLPPSATKLIMKEGYRNKGGFYFTKTINPRVKSNGTYIFDNLAQPVKASGNAVISLAVKPDNGRQNDRLSNESFRISGTDSTGLPVFTTNPWMPGQTMNRFLPTLNHSDTPDVSVSDAAKGNPVCASITFRYKTPTDSRAPSLGYVQCNPVVARTNYGKHPDVFKQPLAQAWFETDARAHPDWDDSYLPQADEKNHGFVASGIRADSGVSFAQMVELPLKPLQSIGALQHLDYGINHYYSHPFLVVGNSVTPPTVRHDSLGSGPISPRPAPNGGYLFQDFSYLANTVLFDRYFYSSIAPTSSNESLAKVYEDHRSGVKALPNSRYLAHGSTSPDDVDNPIEDFTTIASKLMVDGAFNVNSTSVTAWKAILGSLNREAVAYRDLDMSPDEIRISSPDNSHPYVVSRFSLPGGECADTTAPDPDEIPEAVFWRGYRGLSQQQIDSLAEKIVVQIRQRGPFLSLAEFVNRRLSSDSGDRALATRGAIQAALDDPAVSINSQLKMPANSAQIDQAMVADYENYVFPESAVGYTAFGAPGWVTQADILRPLAPYITARSDTFRVRGYGDAKDKQGNVTARAWCEVVVQRNPDFLVSDSDDDSDPDDGNIAGEAPYDDIGEPNPDLNPINLRFGRRFEVVSFRWLNPEEV